MAQDGTNPDSTPLIKLPEDEDIRTRFERVREELAEMKLPDLPADGPSSPSKTPELAKLDEELRLLDARASESKSLRDNAHAAKVKAGVTDQMNSRGLGLGLSIAYMIIGLPMAGVAVGWFLDRQLHTSFWKGILAVSGLTIGLAMTVMYQNRMNRKD